MSDMTRSASKFFPKPEIPKESEKRTADPLSHVIRGPVSAKGSIYLRPLRLDKVSGSIVAFHIVHVELQNVSGSCLEFEAKSYPGRYVRNLDLGVVIIAVSCSNGHPSVR
jgi:hypothetical protein